MIIHKLKGIMPPTYLFLTLVLSVAIHLLFPIKIIFNLPYNFIGIIFVIIGMLLNVQTDNLFRKNKTAVKPEGKTTVLLTEGPFRYSRHPMYLGMILITVGVSYLLGSISSLLPSVLFYLVLEFVFIQFEEDKLEKIFGEKYLEYKKKTRRWI